MQAVPTAAGGRIIKRKLQVVVAEEPVESRPSVVAPAVVTSYAVSLQTSRDCASRFERLLIETSPLTSTAIEALRTDRHKVGIDFATLRFRQPIQRFQASGNHTIIRTC